MENPFAGCDRIFSLEGVEICFFQEVTSTMDIASLVGRKGWKGIIMAEKQTAGRGRYGRSWVSETGGLYLSWVLPLTKPGYLIQVASSSVIAVLRLSGLSNCQLKIPNDIIIQGKKIAGILIEQKDFFSVLGLGVNLNNVPGQKEKQATSFLEMTGRKVEVLNFLEKFIATFKDNYKVKTNEAGVAESTE